MLDATFLSPMHSLPTHRVGTNALPTNAIRSDPSCPVPLGSKPTASYPSGTSRHGRRSHASWHWIPTTVPSCDDRETVPTCLASTVHTDGIRHVVRDVREGFSFRPAPQKDTASRSHCRQDEADRYEQDQRRKDSRVPTRSVRVVNPTLTFPCNDWIMVMTSAHIGINLPASSRRRTVVRKAVTALPATVA